MNRILYFFVENFSNEKSEEFFEKELPYHAENFSKVVVIPLYEQKVPLISNAPNVEVWNFDAFGVVKRIKILFRHLILVNRIFLFEICQSHNKSYYFRNYFSLLNLVLMRIEAARQLKKKIGNEFQHGVFYSYWFDQWVFILAIIKYWDPSIKVISRVHGSDYKEEQIKKILPFRYFQISQLNAIFPVSDYAKKYLIKKFKVDEKKIMVSRLGLPNVERSITIDKNQLTIVSCSSLIPLKRVHLICETLAHISQPVKWYHFGNGPLYNEIKEKASSLPLNITVNFMGHVNNGEFNHFIQNTPVSFFINVSENEGIPVTLMEAARAGIPLIGTDTCGIPEIVNQNTGFLIPVDFNPSFLANLIVKQHLLGDIYRSGYREKIKNFCTSEFSDKKNYGNMSKMLVELVENK